MVKRTAGLKQQIFEISQNIGINLSKKKGQCFLIDQNLLNFIINRADLDSLNDVVLEIGPGFGFLTEKLALKAKKVIAIEYDKKIAKFLKQKFEKPEIIKDKITNIEIINADALRIESIHYNKLISNLPYNISGPLFYKLAAEFNNNFEYGLVMLQEEFINKLTSNPHPKTYGRISVIGNLFFEIQKLKTIPPSVFYPEPKVNSGIIEFRPNKEIPEFLREKSNRINFLLFISGIFPHKNSILSKSIKLFNQNISKNPKNFPYDFVEFHNQNFLLKAQNSSQIEKILKNKSEQRLWSIKPAELLEIYKKLYDI